MFIDYTVMGGEYIGGYEDVLLPSFCCGHSGRYKYHPVLLEASGGGAMLNSM